jgi:chemotaxis protein methyltransferase CheR
MATAMLDAMREYDLTEEDFRFLARQVYDLTGIVIHERKREMLYARLSRRLRSLNLSNFRRYCDYIGGPDGGAEIGAMINAVTTNLTYFFRESHHFEHLRDVALPAVAAAARRSGKQKLRLWSAGCSSGEEPYSIAMTVKSAPVDFSRWDARILATDLDTDMIARAAAGSYRAADAEGIPAALAAKFIDEVATPSGQEIRMRDDIKELIAFRQLNLIGDWPVRGPFDAIFCRNVMIYFDHATKARLINRYADLLRPDGWLYIGHSESLSKVSDRFQPAGRTIYRRIK